MKRFGLILGSVLLSASLGAESFNGVIIVPAKGVNYNVDLGDADLVKFQPTCYGQPGCQDEDGYSYTIMSIVARPWKPRVLLYLGSYSGYTATIHHRGDGGDPNILPAYSIVCPDYHDIVLPLTNHTIELYYDTIVGAWRPVQ